MEIYNPPFEFLADASKGSEVYKIDLLGDAGNGECSCPHYQYRLKQMVLQGHLPSSHTRCKHILLARNLCLQMIIKDVICEDAKRAKVLG